MPPDTRRSVYRRLDSRVRVQRITESRRLPVIAEQLAKMRATAP